MIGAEHPAAAICRDYRSEFEDDWFLPSLEELNQMYLQRKVIGGLAVSYYWSSSQHDSANGCSQSFITGNQRYDSKTHGHTLYVRPIRAF